MNKKAALQEVYQESFNDELEKISKYSPEKEAANKKYFSDMKKIKSDPQMSVDHKKVLKTYPKAPITGMAAGTAAGTAGAIAAFRKATKKAGKAGKALNIAGLLLPVAGMIVGTGVAAKYQTKKRDKVVAAMPSSSKFKAMWQKNREK